MRNPSTDIRGSIPRATQQGMKRKIGWRSSHFKTRQICFCLLLSTFCVTAWGQLAIDWHTVDGGGGTSTGGGYTVSGTIGQPDAGAPMTNGQYSVTGGFWALPIAVQKRDRPRSRLFPTRRVRHGFLDAEHARICAAGDAWPFPAIGSTHPAARPIRLSSQRACHRSSIGCTNHRTERLARAAPNKFGSGIKLLRRPIHGDDLLRRDFGQDVVDVAEDVAAVLRHVAARPRAPRARHPRRCPAAAWPAS